MNDTKVKILLEHHKDTFSYIRQYIKRREKLFFATFFLLALMFLDFTNNGALGSIISAFIRKLTGSNISISLCYMKSLLWFFLLHVVISYFRVNLLIERQYEYLKKIEKQMSILTGFSFERESTGYLKNYPLFCDFAHVLYTYVFPILLLVFLIVEIIKYTIINYPIMYKIVDIVIASAIIFAVGSYLFYLKVAHK